MISRRSITIGLGGLVASPAVARAASMMSVKRIERPIGHKDAEAKDQAVFTICDWDPTESRERKDGDDPILSLTHFDSAPGSAKVETDFLIKIHLSQSWQVSW
jgi:hypothetical protein